MTPSPSRSPRSLPMLGILLGLAVLIGVAVSLLVAAAPTPPTPRAGELIVNLPASFWGVLVLGPLLIGFAAILFRWAQAPPTQLGRSMALAFGTLLVLGAVLLLALSLSHPGAGLVQYVSSGSSGNKTGPPNGSSPGGGTGAAPGSAAPTDLLTIGPWTVLGIVLAISACVALLAVPGVLSRLVDRDRRPAGGTGVDRRRVTEAFVEASAAIAQGGDFRETIVRLYVTLLNGLDPRAGETTSLTPEEIRVRVLGPLGVRPAPARELTRLFEEARYSHHAMGSAEADRFRACVAAIEQDLLRGAAR